jgi:hypothetical protein
MLLSILLICASACSLATFKPSSTIQVAVTDNVPAFPKAGPTVAAELNRACPIIVNEDGTKTSTCPAIDEWLSRLEKLKRQMEVKK